MSKLEETLQSYREAAIGHADPDPAKANVWHGRLHACYKVLRETEEGRKAIASLMADADPRVRGWAAAHCLQWFPKSARVVLEELRDEDVPWQVSFDAEMTLKEYDKGRLTFDY